MKKYLKKALYIVAAVGIIGFSSCNDFEEMNNNPSKSTTTDPNSQLTYAQLYAYGDVELVETNTVYYSAFVQHLQGEWNTTNYGGQYRKYNSQFEKTWNRAYANPLKNIADILANTEDKELYVNVRSLARIFRVYYSMLLTDMHGDIPYTEAGKGYIEGIVKPKYDTQEFIYQDFLKELKEAGDALSAEGGSITGDVIYNGSIDKWKRFANSLRLRLAMRLVKVSSETAKAEVEDILSSAAGVFKSTADNPIIEYQNYFDWDVTEFRRNGISQFWRGREPYPSTYICSTLWDMLKDRNDPRLFIIGRAYDESSPNDPFNRVDLTEEMMEEAGIDKFQAVKPGFFWWDNWPSGYWSNLTNKWQDKACRPQVNNAFLKGETPGIIISYAEVELLLAEANVRWSLTDAVSAEQHYTNGVAAAMNILVNYDKDFIISSDKITAYLSTNPFPSTANDKIKAVNEQLWILHFNNSPEAFSNWRRTGYPQLKASGEYGAQTIDSQTIPRRLPYPITEASYNKEEYNRVVQELGGTDTWNGRVWWDKQ